MARQKNYIKTYNQKDRQAYLYLNNIRHSTKEQLQTFISQNRIKSYLKEGILNKLQTAKGDYYILSQKGYKVFEKQFVRENYKYHSQSPEHDRQLADSYIDVYKNIGADNFVWKNEEDLKQQRDLQVNQLIRNKEYERAESLRTASVTDGYVELPDGSTSCYEVITSNYSQADIQLKHQYAQAIGAKLITDYI